ELHCTVGVIKVGDNGKTAAAGAAYIGCEKTEGHDGRVHNFTYKKNFVTGGIMLPDGAPERWREAPGTIWAEQDYLDYVKSTRRGPKSELYRRGDVALPWVLSDEQCIKIAGELLEPLREKGMVIQWGIHDEPADEKSGQKRNRHLHWMAAMREVTPEGFGKKNRTWNNYNGGLNIPELIRPLAAELLNRELENVGADFRVEHESFEARGIDKIPEIHVGVSGTAIHRKGGKSNRYEKNEEIKKMNQEHMSYLDKLQRYRDERAAASELLLNESKEKMKSFEDIIAAASTVKGLKEPLKTAREEAYRQIKKCNGQIYTLKNDKKKTEQTVRALHLIKNLAGDPNLNDEQEKELAWAVGYLQWAGMEDLGPASVNAEIRRLRENNTQRVLESNRLKAEKERLYGDLTKIKMAEKSQKQAPSKNFSNFQK
ncbi:MAG: MobA/MobL family protein, partial [Acutalibacteraceae bacterium]|nr:MobA/MobL family protein [Acutalibacteraceae bacterium]